MQTLSRVVGCVVGGAVGDALGAAVEFLSIERIRQRFGADGITDFAPAYGRLGAITDDTQMTLFTADGLLRAYVRGVHDPDETVALVHDAYLRWFETQNRTGTVTMDGWLPTHEELWSVRAPGNTCLSALAAFTRRGQVAHNDSKGCGTVMRVAPVGLLLGEPFDVGARVSRLTHGHPTGAIAGGAFAQLITLLLDGRGLADAAVDVGDRFLRDDLARETRDALDAALDLAERGPPPGPETVERLGGGWVAEQALGIALYCALVAGDFAHGVCLAANHSGDSDSTASMAGQILGVRDGIDTIPPHWAETVELAPVLVQIAHDLHDARMGVLDSEAARQRYP